MFLCGYSFRSIVVETAYCDLGLVCCVNVLMSKCSVVVAGIQVFDVQLELDAVDAGVSLTG